MWVYAKKTSCLATLPRNSIFSIQSIHTSIFCHVFAWHFDARHEKALNLIFYRSKRERKWHEFQQICMIAIPSSTSNRAKKSIYKWFNSNFFYSCDCPFFVETTLANFHIFRVWRCGQCAFCFFAFFLPILSFDFYFRTLPVPFNSICELRLNCISLN